MAPSGKAVVAGVAGWPVSHSRSPRLHGHWLERYGIDGLYAPFPIAPARFEAAISGLAAAGLAGLNVTVPHKEAAFRLCESHDAVAEILSAANTLVFNADGSIEGRNTDVFGFAENLKAAGQGDLHGSAVVLGAGGAARAVVLALQQLGIAHVRLANRTRDRATAVADDLGNTAPGATVRSIEVVDWSDRSAALAGASVLVNATSLGMQDQPALDIVLDDLPNDALITDIVYTPLTTPLLHAARQKGNEVVDGLGMLLHQGRPGFRAWFGVDPAVDADLRRAVAGDLMDQDAVMASTPAGPD